MLKPWFLLCPILLAVPVPQQTATPPQQPVATPVAATPPPKPVVPAEEAAMVNPVRPTAESLGRAKKFYGYDCAVCHGANGDGKGELNADSHLHLKDFTDAASLSGATDGELFYIIKNGTNGMPPEGDRAKTDELWNMVIVVRSFANKG
jgi:mono/diheme cytochrome c family protein